MVGEMTQMMDSLINWAGSEKDRIIEPTRKTLEFINTHRSSRPYLLFLLQQESSRYTIHPLVKIKVTSSVIGKKRVVRTITLGCPLFPQVLSSFGVNKIEAGNIYGWISNNSLFSKYTEVEKYYSSVFTEYVGSDEFKADVKSGKKKMMDRLHSKMTAEIADRFRVLVSLGSEESTISDLYRRIEIENVLRV